MSGDPITQGAAPSPPGADDRDLSRHGADDAQRYRALIGDLRQLASVRRVEYLDGAERGLEALELRAGPLALTLLAGRALDIGQVYWKGLPLGWISPAGHTNPSHIAVESDGGRGFERGFSGFLNTCGLTHTRQPRNGLPLHGHLAFLPARVLSAYEDQSLGVLVVEAEVRQWRLNHENLRLRRRIEVPFDGSQIALRDTLTNEGVAPAHPQLLYHINFGFPAVRETSRLLLNGEVVIDQPAMPDPGPLQPSRMIDAGSEPTALARLETGSFAADLTFSTASLPSLQLWRDLSPGRGVFSVEPVSGPSGVAHPVLDPGHSRSFQLIWRFEGELSLG